MDGRSFPGVGGTAALVVRRLSGSLRTARRAVAGRSGPDLGLVLVAHATVHALELSLPLFVVAWSASFGVGPAALGSALALAYGVFGLGAVPGGVLADRYGPRPLIALSLLGMGAAFLALGVVPGFGGVVVALAGWGLAASVYHPAGLSLLGREASGDGFAAHGVAGNVGTVAGPVATALLLGAFDWRLVAGLLGAPAAFAGAVASRGRGVGTARLREIDPRARTDGGWPSVGSALRNSRRAFSRGFLTVFVLVMLYGLYYRGMLTFLPDLAAGLGGLAPVAVGGWTVVPGRYFYAGLLAAGVGGQYLGGRLVERLPVELGLAGAFGLLAAIGVLFAAVGTTGAGTGPVLLLGGVLGVVLFATQPLYQAAVAAYATGGTRGLSYGYTYAGVFGIGAIGGAAAGVLLRYASPAALFALLALVAVLGTAVALTAWR